MGVSEAPPTPHPEPYSPVPTTAEDEELDAVAALPSAAHGEQKKETAQRDDTSTVVDEVLLPYTFGRTPSLRVDTSPRPSTMAQPTLAVRPRLDHRSSSYSSISSAGTSSAMHHVSPKPYTLPPGLAASSSAPPAAPPLPSPGVASYSPTGPMRPVPRTTQPFPRQTQTAVNSPRSARIVYEPPIPLDVQILLLTTPPPPAPAQSVTKGTSLARGEAQAYRDELLAAERARRAREDKRLSGKARRLLSGSISYLAGPSGGSRRADGATAVPSSQRDADDALPIQALEALDLNRTRRVRDTRKGSGRIDSKAPIEYVPKTWKAYEIAYAAGQLDVEDPPFPPLGAPTDATTPISSMQAREKSASLASLTPYELAHFPAPLHLSPITPIRERLIAQLDLLGSTFTLPTSTASAVPLHQSSDNSPAPSLPSAGSSTTSGRRDSLMQSFSTPDGRRASNASTVPSTMHSQTDSAALPYLAGHPPGAPVAPIMVNTRPYGQSQPLTVDAISAMTLSGHPNLLALLRRSLYAPLGSQALLKPAPKAAMITLFPTPGSSSLTILASINLPMRTTSLPLSHALDAHVLLAGERGLVVPDTERDWRFRGNEVVCMSPSNPMGTPYGSSGLGIRFFAGVPIFAPSLPSLAGFEEEAGGRIAIGTVSLLDDSPRTSKFGSSDRANLRSLASQVTHEIERFLRQREQHRFARRTSTSSTVASAPIQGSSNSVTATLQEASRASKTASGNFSGPQRRGSVELGAQSSRRGSVSDREREIPPNLPAPTASLPAPPVKLSPILASRRLSSIFSGACTSLAQSLNLSLVYLVSLDLTSCPPAPSIVGQPTLTLVAAHNLPVDSNASFDPALHLRALRAPEGGLLYRARASTVGDDQTKGGFASGILLPFAESEHIGWVLAGYTTESGRKWGEGEMIEFDKVRDGLAKVVLWQDTDRNDGTSA